MLYIPRICDHLKILTDKKVKNFAIVNFDEVEKYVELT